VFFVVLPGVVYVGSLFTISRFSEWKTARKATAEKRTRDAKLNTVCLGWEAQHPIGAKIDRLYGEWDDGTKIPEGGVELGTPEGCTGPLEDAYNKALKCSDLKVQIATAVTAEKKSKDKYQKYLVKGGSVSLQNEYDELCKPIHIKECEAKWKALPVATKDFIPADPEGCDDVPDPRKVQIDPYAEFQKEKQ
jgi:hypothetical protein